MKHLARYAWVLVLGTALALSWWSLDALARHYGMPTLLAGMVSATFDGAALVAADQALRRAVKADSAAAVKLLMVAAVALSTWLNFEHGLLLGYPMPVRIPLATPPVIAGWLFELQLRGLHRERLHELGRTTKPLPQFGFLVWAFHPFAAVRRVSQITGSRLRSVPVTVMDWSGTAELVRELEEAGPPVLLAAPIEAGDEGPERPEARIPQKSGRSPVPDELYVGRLRELVDAAGGTVPSARDVARKLSIGQDRARRLVALMEAEQVSSGQ
jgi:hypothetical protein